MKKLFRLLLALLLFSQQTLALDVIQNVARSFVIEAPALDKTDGVTPETALTMTTFVIKAYKKNKAPLTITAALAAFASSTLTSTGTAPADNDTGTFTGTLDGTLLTEVYRFKTAIAQANDVLIGASAAASLDNLKCAINDSGCTEGTQYGTGTVASVLVNATTNTDTTQVVVANIPGTLGNSFTTAEASAQLSWTGANLASGVDGLIHDASGYHWFAAPATTWDTLGDMLLTFNYNAEAAPFFQKVRVVASASNDVNVKGIVSTAQGVWDIAKTAADDTAGSIGEHVSLVVTGSPWDKLRSSHLSDNSFGLALGTRDWQTTIATLASQTSFTLTAGSADNDAYNGWVAVVTDVTTNAQRAAAVVDDYTGATKTVALRTDPAVFTMAVGDYVTLVPPGPPITTVPRGVAYSNFTFSMVDATDGQTLETGLTVSGTISKDGGAFSALTNSVSEIGTTGRYKVNLTAAEFTADEVYLAFTATGARRVEFKIRPQK